MSELGTKEELAEQIARAIFACGDEPNDKVHRIQFRGGKYARNETDLGGLCEESLARIILGALEKQS